MWSTCCRGSSSMGMISKVGLLCLTYRSHVLQVFLDPKDRNTTEYKVDTFAGVYKRLTGKDITFEFPVQEAA